MVQVKEDLTGRKFCRLTVVEQAEDYVYPDGKKRAARWKCICDCDGKEVIVAGAALKNGKVKSCGCYCRDKSHERLKKFNDYEIQENYVIMYTPKDEMFLIDLEDFWKVKDFCWNKNQYGYIVTYFKDNEKIKGMSLHRFVMGFPNDMLVDHRDGDKTNNMKYNLRIATNYQNGMNASINSRNTSGVTGVHWDNKLKNWMVRISVNGKRIYLGNYDDFEDAVRVRKKAEEEYYGEWSYDNSRVVK